MFFCLSAFRFLLFQTIACLRSFAFARHLRCHPPPRPQEQKVLLEKVLAEDALPVGSLATPVLQIALPAQTALAEVEAELVQNTVALVCVWMGGWVDA